jgi:hypothetical protein
LHYIVGVDPADHATIHAQPNAPCQTRVKQSESICERSLVTVLQTSFEPLEDVMCHESNQTGPPQCTRRS